MSHKFQPPTFQSQGKNFREHYVGETNKKQPRQHHKSVAKKTKMPPHLTTKSNIQPQVSELTLTNTKGENVKVMVKNTATSDSSKVKKTGPLSPRAPEKIKKNRAEEMKVCGENACLALFAQRPEAIVRVWATVAMSHKIGEILSYLAQHKKVYHVVDNEELTLVSGSEHHGGICMLVKKARPFTLQGYLAVPRQQDCLLLLDNIQNPQNIGGILRTCAFFGVKNILVNDAENLNSSSAMRIAEGGAEHIRVLQQTNLAEALSSLRQAGYQIVHISQEKAKGTHFNQLQLKDKVVLVLTETNSQHLAKQEDSQVVLSYNNPLKNGLNVVVNAGILLSKWYFR